MPKILVLDNEECRTMEEACNWLREAYIYEPYNIWLEESKYGDCIEMEANRGNPGGESYTFYSFEDILRFIGKDNKNYIKEVDYNELD